MCVFADVFCVKNSPHFPLMVGVRLLTEKKFARKNVFTFSRLNFSTSLPFHFLPSFPKSTLLLRASVFSWVILSFHPFFPSLLSPSRARLPHPLSLSFSHPFSSPLLPHPFLPPTPAPSPAPQNGGPGYNPREILEIADVRT